MTDISLEDVEFIKILANSDSLLLEEMNNSTRTKLYSQIRIILCEYYKEKTMSLKSVFTEKFEKAGITEDEGKAAIACARRLGIEIS